MQKTAAIKKKRLVLLQPEQSFLKLFSNKLAIRKIVLTRNDDPHVFALNEWPNYLLLKYLFFLPFFFLVVSFAILMVLFILPFYFFNSKHIDYIFSQYVNLLELVAVTNNEHKINYSINAFASNFINPKNDSPVRKVLYLHSSEKKVILQINLKKAYKHIDEIWLYEKIEEIYDKCVLNKYYLEHSYIVINKQIITEFEKENETSNYINIQWLHGENKYILQAVKRRDILQYRASELMKPKVPRITLKPNNFLTPEIVYYHESEFHPEINRYLFDNYDRINIFLESKGMHFVYLPKLLQKLEVSDDIFLRDISYEFPDVFKGTIESKHKMIENIFQNIDTFHLTKSISIALEIPDLCHPCFLHSLDISEYKFENRSFNYSVFNIDHIFEIDKRIDYYIDTVNISIVNDCYRLIEIDPEDPDEVFDKYKDEIASSLEEVINTVKAFNNKKLIIGSLVYIIKNLKDSQPELCENLNKVLYDTIRISNQPISRLLIDEKYKIFLIDYDNIEIELSPLPKALFIFLLNHPEGIFLKELYQHRSEMIEIYGQIGNRLDMDQITKSIQDLTDARTNSINEKCSRIKEAFLAKIDDTIAQNYYVTGSRSQKKGIILDRSFVIFSGKNKISTRL
jgi:hypothetical protein